MSDQKTYDPFSLWKQYYRDVESNWSKAFEENMKKEEYSESMGNMLDFNLLYKQMVDKSTKQYLEHMNLPTKEDISNISTLIINLDSKVDDLEDQVEESFDSQMPSSVVKREITLLKKEMKEVHSKLDDIFSLLKEK